MIHHPPPHTRVLLIDGSPGATTLLILAAHGAIPAFQAVLVPDTGKNLTQTHRPLAALRRVATAAGMDWTPVKAGNPVQASLDGAVLPLPLFTLTPDGAPASCHTGAHAAKA